MMEQVISIILTIVSIAVPSFLVYFTMKRADRLEQKAENFLQILDVQKNKEGDLVADDRLISLSKVVGSSVAESLKMTLLGQLSGQARIEGGLKKAMAMDILDNKFPILNLAGDLFGANVKKYVAKHPEAMMQIGQMAMPYIEAMTRAQHPTGSSNMGISKPKWKFGGK